jgi:hypothetical protein
MPRKSPYSIVLTEKEKKKLESMAQRYTAPYFSVVRAKIVLLAAQGSPMIKSLPDSTYPDK